MYISSSIIIAILLNRVVLASPQPGGRIERGAAAYVSRKTAPESGVPLQDIPQYVLDHAPLVHLHSQEKYWPSDLGEHLDHTTPYLNFTAIPEDDSHPTLETLGLLNKYDGAKWVFLNSNDNVEEDPEWIRSEYGIPGTDASKPEANAREWSLKARQNRTSPVVGAQDASRRSAAPAILIVVEKDNGIVDAFWFFFYSFNLGNTFFGIRFGNHVGDWEHFCLRFQDGVPKESFFSEHAWGSAFTYDALEKKEGRSLIFSASGTHAMYSTPGIQSYILPFSILHDETDRGPLWDPVQNLYAFNYKSIPKISDEWDMSSPSHQFIPSSLNLQAPTSFLTYAGAWGDKEFPKTDKRQYGAPFVRDKHYVNGPRGPLLKDLERAKICPYEKCVVKDSIRGRSVFRRTFINWAAGCILFWALMGILFAIFFTGRRVGTIFSQDSERMKSEEVEEAGSRPLLSYGYLSRSRHVNERTPLFSE